MHLATKGYLKITRLENKGIIFKSEDYQLDKLKMEGNLSSTDKRLMEGLFSSSKTSVKLSELKNKFYKDLLDIKDYTYKTGVEKGYFAKNPKNTKTLFIILGLFVGMISLVIGGILSGFLGPFVFLSAGISAAIVIIFATIMPKKTLKGVYVKEKILGLKEYLKVAEKDRIKFHNAPAKNPQHFETLLPYAMVLGVEKEWAKQFEGIYNQPPSWYSDQSGGTFNSLILIHSLSNFNQSANAAIASHPGSAAGGSGFGGGGFSGGGFGGGGGGSW
ncbi:MAG: DUF2207 domain-containing protein [Candidatus Portnoybacteria bacterium]|nr:DUF2207 domain-containing protein [Candidatus Portnoybacteria bacterium]